jgi:cation-transporting ATPase E
MLEPAIPGGTAATLAAVRDEWTARGLRVLLFATCPDPGALGGGGDDAGLPGALTPLGVLAFADELRPEAAATLARFAEVGVRLKVISGDHPETVAALAARAGLPRDDHPVSGLDLVGMDDARLADVAEAAAVFGRVTPEQKERLVRALRGRVHYVAMVGDGVNDVLSLKEAQLGVAMLGGSQATRAVADVVLLNDSFGALPPAFREGQRIVGGMRDVIALFLTRSLYVTLVILGASVVGADFPVTPKHNAILALLTVGIPTLALAAWARPSRPQGGLLRSIMPFVLPAALTITLGGLAVYLFELRTTGDVAIARSALTTFTVLCGLLLIPFAEPPVRGWVGGDDLSPDWRPSAMAAALLAAYVAVLAVPTLRDSFELTVLSAGDYAGIVALVAAWALFLRFAWRARLLERYLGFRID